MPNIQVLPKQIAELIAAGEVVERPASVVKELVENAIDAGATAITVELQRGGITFIRITDNGCGIAHDDVPLAFLRHATSKIQSDGDLNAIATLGFRGEALAAVSSVSRVEMFTKTGDEPFGTHIVIEGGEQTVFEEAGCPDGTTIVIRDLFFNTPARMKFLKKDTSEANAAAAVLDRMALSHPEVAFKLIRDGKQSLNTTGDGAVKNAVYSVLGREFSNSLIPADGVIEGTAVRGLICKPVACRPTRNSQFVFLNGRLVRSGTVTAAVEQAYKNSAMIGKFPGFVLYLTVPFDTVDVNVHPAKTEVRFSDEKRIFDAVYTTVKNALLAGDTRPEVQMKKPVFNPFARLTADEYRQTVMRETAAGAAEKQTAARSVHTEPLVPAGIETKARSVKPAVAPKPTKTVFAMRDATVPAFAKVYSFTDENGGQTVPLPADSVAWPTGEPAAEPGGKPPVSVSVEKTEEEERLPVLLIGEAFQTYIIVQMGSSIFMIDKHAAHERILFNQLKKQQKPASQALLSPVTAVLPREEYDALLSHEELLRKSGFELEDFGNAAVLVRAVPATLVNEDITLVLSEIAGQLTKASVVKTKREENLLHTVACRAAIKAGSHTAPLEMQRLAETVLYSDEIRYCPHGRPVAFEIKKYELEKQFGRIQ